MYKSTKELLIIRINLVLISVNLFTCIAYGVTHDNIIIILLILVNMLRTLSRHLYCDNRDDTNVTNIICFIANHMPDVGKSIVLEAIF